MKNQWGLALVFLSIGALNLTALAQAPVPENQGLGGIAREERAKRQRESPALVIVGTGEQAGQTGQDEQNESRYVAEVQALLLRNAWTELDAAADSARKSKERLAGGAWKLYILYATVGSPQGGQKATDGAWASHLSLLESWVKAHPESITARVALADAYRNFGWKGRGQGKADTVSDAGWQQLNNLDEKALKTLTEAANLPQKCPHWYFVMLEIARDQDWGKSRTRALLESAIALEPEYYHSYREFANNLLPKWHGQPGEGEAFTEEISHRVPQGPFVYFELATVLYCGCGEVPTLSWSAIKDGFTQMDRTYVATTLKLNRFAMLTYMYKDRDAARSVLMRIGDHWDPTVWRNLDAFNVVRKWAGLPTS
jgi:hypothetical protein